MMTVASPVIVENAEAPVIKLYQYPTPRLSNHRLSASRWREREIRSMGVSQKGDEEREDDKKGHEKNVSIMKQLLRYPSNTSKSSVKE